MTVTIQINGENVEVKLTPEQYNKALAEIEESKKPKKFEFKYPEECYLVTTTYVDDSGGQNPALLENGRYRLTVDVAERSLARNRHTNRLEALAEMLNGLKEWKYGEFNYFIYRSGHTTIWSSTFTSGGFYPDVVYMTKECAVEICQMLNEGEFEL